MTTWMQHVKKVHASGNTSFKESLKRASTTWKKGATPKAAPKKAKKRGRKKKAKDEPAQALGEEEKSEEPVVKKKRRRRKTGPKIPAKAFKDIDSRNL